MAPKQDSAEVTKKTVILGIFKFVPAYIYIGLGFFLAFNGQPAELTAFTLCGAIGLTFIYLDKISEFTGAGFSVKTKQNEMEKKIWNLEDDIGVMKQVQEEPEFIDFKNDDDIQNDEFLKILDFLVSGKFTFRSLTSICKNCKFDTERALELLHQMENLGLVLLRNSHAGIEMWAASPTGKMHQSIHRDAQFIENP